MEHIPHLIGDTLVGSVHNPIDMVVKRIRIRVLEHRDQEVQRGLRLELNLTQIGATLIRRGAMDGVHYHQESIWELTERQRDLIPMLQNAQYCEIQTWWRTEDIPQRWLGD